jgi:hypothetical protein
MLQEGKRLLSIGAQTGIVATLKNRRAIGGLFAEESAE